MPQSIPAESGPPPAAQALDGLPGAIPCSLREALLRGDCVAAAQFPGGPELLARFQAVGGASPAAPVWMRLAHALNAEQLRGKPRIDPHWAQAFWDVLPLAWPGFTDDQRRAHGLYAAQLRCAAELSLGEWLAREVQVHADAWRAGEQPGAALVLLRALKRLGRLEACQALVDLLAEWLDSLPAWPQADPPHAPDWPAELASAAVAVARQARTWAALHWTHAWLQRLLPVLLARLGPAESGDLSDGATPTEPEAPSPQRALHRDLAGMALATLDLPALRQLAERLCRRPGLSSLCVPILIDMLGRLAQFDATLDVDALLELAATRLPRHPLLALERGKRALLAGADELSLLPLFEIIDPALPGYQAAGSWLASRLALAGAEAQAVAWYRRIEAVVPLSSLDQLRLAQLQVRQAPETTQVLEAPLFDERVPPALQQALAGLVALAELSPCHDAPFSREAWAARCAASVPAFAQALRALPPLPLTDVLPAARQLGAHARPAFWLKAFPFALEPAYGQVDPVRYLALQHAIADHLLALVDWVLEAPEPLAGGGRLSQLIDLLQLRCDTALSLDRPADALVGLNRLGAQLGAMAHDTLQALRERCALAMGDLPAAAALRAGLRGGREAEILRLQPWAEWLAAAGASESCVLQDGAVQGHFDSVRSDGVVHRYSHATVPTRLSLVPMPQLRVRNSHLLISREGGVLLPEPWHLSMGDYPYDHPQVLSRGREACVLAPPGQVRRIVQPVLVLANQDATYHRNFYHWVVLILARVRWLQAQGWLDRRPLLMPQELSGWMRSSLQDLGVPPDRLIEYADGETLQLDDALVLSPLEYVCRPLMDDLCRQLWRAAGLDPDHPPAPSRLLYISRQSAHRRPLVNEERIMAMAQAMGFELVAPETLPLLAQVRLFATARGIAGPPGAAFTNLSWCQPGSRLLSIFKEEINLPTFVDISVQRGQQHRWLLGRNLDGFDFSRVVAAPFSVPLDLAERELAWVAGA